MTADEARSRIYAWLADRTSRPDGSEWDHATLRPAVDELLERIRPALTPDEEPTQ